MDKKPSSEWNHLIDLADIFTLFESGKLTPYHFGHAVAGRIKNDEDFFESHKDDEEFISIVNEFETIADIDHFNDTLNRLYDWSDKDKRCWIQTFHLA